MRFDYVTCVGWVLAIFALSAAPTCAAEAREILSAREFGLVQDLRWGMSAAEARRALGNLTLSPDPGPFDPRLARLGRAPFTSVAHWNLTMFLPRQAIMPLPQTHIYHANIERTLTAVTTARSSGTVPEYYHATVDRTWNDGIV
jgi:hypothetical protein